MRANLDATHGLIMAEAVSFALAEKIGKSDAHKLVEEASKKAVAEKRGLKDVLADDKRVTAQLSKGELENLFDPLSYQGVAQSLLSTASSRPPKPKRPVDNTRNPGGKRCPSFNPMAARSISK